MYLGIQTNYLLVGVSYVSVIQLYDTCTPRTNAAPPDINGPAAADRMATVAVINNRMLVQTAH